MSDMQWRIVLTCIVTLLAIVAGILAVRSEVDSWERSINSCLDDGKLVDRPVDWRGTRGWRCIAPENVTSDYCHSIGGQIEISKDNHIYCRPME